MTIVTSHRLIRCSSTDLLGHASDRHAQQPTVSGPGERAVPGWRYGEDPPPDKATQWCSRLPDGSLIRWTLEVEPGANGVLAHLSAAATAGPVRRLPARVRRLALQAWVVRELSLLAQSVEVGRAQPGHSQS